MGGIKLRPLFGLTNLDRVIYGNLYLNFRTTTDLSNIIFAKDFGSGVS